MINKLSLILLVLLFTLTAFGQRDAFVTPSIMDSMTENPDQNKKWRKGLSKYPANPRSAWELGIHGGHYIIDGDVDRRIPGGFGLGIHLRKAIQYNFSLRLDFFYGQAFGVDAQVWTHASDGGGLVEPIFADYEGASGWYPRVKTHYAYINFQTIINVGNILFHKERNSWNFYMLVGGGLDTHQAMLDLYTANGSTYNTAGIQGLGYDFDLRDDRIMIKNEVDELYDGKYETKGFQKEGIFKIADQYNIHLNFIAGIGLSRKLNKRVNIGIEHQVLVSDNDYLDGIKYRTANDQTNNLDIGHYTSIRAAINLGNLKERSEPLYWLNPLDGTFNDISELKQRPILDLTDSDADGVIDMLDMEPDSPLGARVDTRGITLDSDSDGIADFEDEEPFSAPGFATNDAGVAKIPEQKVSAEDVEKIVLDVIDREATKFGQGRTDWYLPMIHFDLNNFLIKPEFLGQLKHVADIMKKYPDLCITAQGHTDSRNTDEYNISLSYKRANAAIKYLTEIYEIPRDRFRLMYSGESMPMVPGLPDHQKLKSEDEKKQYMNRRVEFRTCLDTDFDMPEPGANKDKIISSNYPGTKRKSQGHMNSGY